MKTTPGFIALALLLAACATPAPRPAPAAGNLYSGEVWTWDERESTVTLRQGGQQIRVKVSPDQLVGLTL
ncbi:MAG TPA: hypothetical protein VFX28_15395, partial [Methylomirabilota bacterium]|nr:hypothetical protein [Methylomirabilota bacterium]